MEDDFKGTLPLEMIPVYFTVPCQHPGCPKNATTSRETAEGWQASCEEHRRWLQARPAPPAVTHTGQG